MIDLDLVAQHRPHVESMTPSEQDALFAQVFAHHRATGSITSDPTVDDLRLTPSEPQPVLPHGGGRFVLTLAAGTLVVVGAVGALWAAARNDPTPSPRSSQPASSSPASTSDSNEPAPSTIPSISATTEPADAPPIVDDTIAVPDRAAEPVPYNELVTAALQDIPPPGPMDMDEYLRLSDEFEERFTLTDELDASGTSRWWATAWTGTFDDGSQAVCIGTILSVSCINDTTWYPIAPVTVHRIGGAPPELVLIVEAGVTVTDIRIDDQPRDVHQTDLEVPSGRSAIALSIPETAGITVSYTDTNDVSSSYFIEFTSTEEPKSPAELPATPWAPTDPEQ